MVGSPITSFALCIHLHSLWWPSGPRCRFLNHPIEIEVLVALVVIALTSASATVSCAPILPSTKLVVGVLIASRLVVIAPFRLLPGSVELVVLVLLTAVLVTTELVTSKLVPVLVLLTPVRLVTTKLVTSKLVPLKLIAILLLLLLLLLPLITSHLVHLFK